MQSDNAIEVVETAILSNSLFAKFTSWSLNSSDGKVCDTHLAVPTVNGKEPPRGWEEARVMKVIYWLPDDNMK